MLLPALILLLQQPATPSPATPPAEPPRRRPVTAALQSTAFADTATQNLFLLARRARVAQDSALRGYDAKTRSRITVNLGTSVLTRNRLLFRTENVANVKWRRGQGMWIEPLATRTTVPMAGNVNVNGAASQLTPVPYFPGREQLWMPSSESRVVQKDVDESDGFIHPLAEGSEAYYRYAIGDSLRIKLPSGEGITLRELRVTARKAEWRSFVGSFWFDARSGSLVRAAYRLSAPFEVWNEVTADARRELEEAKRDTTPNRQKRIDATKEDMPPALVRGLMNPMRFDINLVTVEYALYEGKFWLPRVNRAEGNSQVMFMRTPLKIEESYTYDDVDGTTPLPAMPVRAAESALSSAQVCVPACEDVVSEEVNRVRALRARRTEVTDSLLAVAGLKRMPRGDTTALAVRTRFLADSLYKAYEDTLLKVVRVQRRALRDSLLAAGGKVVPAETDSSREARRLRTYGDSLVRASIRNARVKARNDECARNNGTYSRMESRYGGALQYAVRMPCDSTVLASSKELPPSPYDPNEEVFSQRDADALASSLGLSLQPGFAPQPPQYDFGITQQRYNRVEGFSLGGEVRWQLGAGYTASGSARIGVADWQPNAELRLARSNGRTTVQAAAFRRLAYTNDFGNPLSVGASFASLLYGRDEGFYYRTLGGELTWTRERPSSALRWRAFVERQDEARKRWNWNVANTFSSNREMLANIVAREGTVAGGAAEWRGVAGLDPMGWQVAGELRGEAAGGAFNYGRALGEVTVSRPLFWRLSFAQTASAGIATDSVPLQRQFFMGGLRTVRGQVAGTRVGPAYWLSRSELGLGVRGVRRTLFLDLGWAGDRRDFASPGRPIAGWGLGSSFADGLLRIDASRGIYPRKGTRFDISLGARF